MEKPNTGKYLGCSIDIGTMNLVSARRTPQGVTTKRMRDSFLDLPLAAKKMLALSNTSFVVRDDEELLLLGDAALEMANIFGREARRPLSAGLISPNEVSSLDVLGLLVKSVLGPPLEKGEVCYFSVPAAPVDQPERDVVYHRGVFEKIVAECGYTARAANEAMAIIFSETASDGFSGISMSFGSGMTNVALAVNTIEALSFSVARGGDWIDSGAAKSIGSTQARMCAVKERGINLLAPKGREEEALAFYYKAMIEYVFDQIVARLKQTKGQIVLQKPIPLVVSGGTSMAGSFMPLFTQMFEERRKKFPVEISEVRAAKEPLNAVALGLLVQAQQDYE